MKLHFHASKHMARVCHNTASISGRYKYRMLRCVPFYSHKQPQNMNSSQKYIQRITTCLAKQKLLLCVPTFTVICILAGSLMYFCRQTISFQFIRNIPYTVKCMILKSNTVAGHVAHMGEERGVYRVLVGKPEGRRPRRRWVDNIRMDLWGEGGV